MKLTLSFFVCFILLSFNASSQEKLSGHLNTGLIVPFNDFTDNSFKGDKTNVFASVGLGYELASNFKLRGDFSLGNLDGDNNINYYETSFYEGFVFAQYNIVPLFSESRFKFNINAGAGLLLYYSRLYNLKTRVKVAESPIPSERSLSPNPVIGGGFEMAYPLADNLDINLGFTEKMVLFNDYMDVLESGDFQDFYGFANVGLTFYLKDKRDKSKLEIDQSKYNQLITTIDSLEKAGNAGNTEKIARLEMESQEKELQIQMLRGQLDSMRAKVVTIDTDRPGQELANPDAEAILAREQYRVIVASLPSRTMAQRWIDRSSLDKSEMIIVYVDDVNSYRVVYKSYDTYEAARKEQQQIKSAIPDAWIIKF